MQYLLAGVPEGRVSEIVCKCDRLGQVCIKPQGRGNGPCNLRDFKGMG